MVDGQDVDLLLINDPVDNPVAVERDLTEGLDLELRNHPAEPRMLFESIRCLKGLDCEQRSDVGSVACDEQADGVEIFQGLLGPAY